jgi:hypothetical protein
MKRLLKKISTCCFVLFALSISPSCSKKPVTIPTGILTKEELVPVLVDVHLAQSVIDMNRLRDTSGYTLYDYSTFIFKANHISKEKYDSSMAFYTGHPELLEEIYQDVINELSKKQSEVERK